MPQVAYRAVRSRRKFVKAPQIVRCVGAEMDRRVKPHFIRQFNDVVSDWNHKPKFKARKVISGESIKLFVFPAGKNKKIWTYVSRGTRRHKIRPKKPGGLLAFTLGYSARTKARGKAHVGTGKATGDRVFAAEVDHPGTEAREFEEVIADENKGWYSRTMESIWRRCIRRA